MIAGIGTDMIEIARIERACQKEYFLSRCYTKNEREMFGSNYVKAAGNFAVKEAISKLFGTGFRGFQLMDIEVLREESGKPYVNLYGNAKKMADNQQIVTIHVSITNTKEFASAFVVGERERQV